MPKENQNKAKAAPKPPVQVMSTKRIGESAENELKEQELMLAKRLTAKKVIYIEIDDEITAIYDRIKQVKMKNIYIVVPKRAILFQSIINLKILKRKAEDLEKNVYIITNDPNGLHLAKQIGLIVYDKLEGHEHPSLVSGKFLEDQQNITPLKASINALEDDLPTLQTEKKLSISEIMHKGKGKSLALLAKSLKFKAKEPQKKTDGTPKNKLVLIAPNRQALLSLVVVSFIILLTIVYIALPGATIKLTPKSTVLDTSANIILADFDVNQAELNGHPENEIPSYTITAAIKRPLTYAATGKEFSDLSQNSKGIITIINTSNADWPLVPKTQFKTSNNLIFRSQNYVTVPAQKNNVPGSIDIPVEADQLDESNQVIGERGNIGPSKFIIFKLSAENQKKLYAESKNPMTGGKAMVVKKITSEDLASARKKMEDDLKNSAQAELQANLEKYNQEHKTNLILLTDPKSIQTDAPKITVPSNLENQKQDSFDIQGEIKATGIAYSQDEMLNILKSKLKEKKSPEKRLLPLTEESLVDFLTYQVVEVDLVNKKVKITAKIKGIEQFEISPDKENGDRLIKQIKEHVVGKDIQEAHDYIQNLPQIDKVKIDSWPAWAPTMPGVPDNIKVEIATGE